MKRKVKILIDIAMYVIFLYLMSYRAGRGLYRHGVLGCVLFALFLIHHVVNLRWYRSLGKGKYTFVRGLFLVLDLLLFAAMIVMAVSSVMMSGDIFAFSPFTVTQTARNLHVLSTSWGFLLMVFHVGLHTNTAFTKLYRKVRETFFAYAYDLLFLLVLAIGIWCFYLSGLWRNMLLIPHGNPAFEPLRFYGEYLMITLAACQIVHLLLLVSGRIRNRKKRKQEQE